MGETDWVTVALAALNVVQTCLLAWVNQRQQQLHHRLNGGIDEWLERRRARDAKRAEG